MKKHVNDCDIRERELLSRRKELESWDALLREKDRKVATEQRSLDEREATIRTNEEKNKAKEIEMEKKNVELKQQEVQLQEMTEKYERLLAELDERDKVLKERDREYHALRKDLNTRDEELKRWEKHLSKLQEQMRGIESREKNLRNAEEAFRIKEDEFYNVKVAQITARHNQELKSFEDIIQKQLKIASDFQKELEIARQDFANKTQEAKDLEVNNHCHCHKSVSICGHLWFRYNRH
jgi:hypothetical protein